MFQDEMEKYSKSDIIDFTVNFAKAMDVSNKSIPLDQRLSIHETLIGLSKESIRELMEE